MRVRFVFVFSLLVAGAVSACGGGGGGGGTPATSAPTPTLSPSPGPTVAANPFGCVGVNAVTRGTSERRAVVGVQPTSAAGSATYAGTYSEVIDRASPCPIGTSSATATVGIQVSTTASTEQDVETDASSTNTTVLTTNANITNTVTGASSLFTESSETTTDLVGDMLTTTYGNGALTYAVASPIPYTNSITNVPPSEVKDALADSSMTDRLYNAANDGTYTETDTLAGVSQSNTIAVTTGGAANYVVQTPNFISANQISSITFNYAAPAGGNIVATVTYTGGAMSPPPLTIKSWFSGALYSDVTTDAGSGALPSQCAATGTPASAQDFHRVITDIDPALGSSDTRTIDSYVVQNYGGLAVAGPACVVISDTQKLYYDYFFDTPAFIYISEDGNPFQTDTISESYWLTSSPTTLTRVRSASSPSDVPGLETSIAGRNAGLNFVRATQRTQRLEQFAKNLRSLKTLKGVIIK